MLLQIFIGLNIFVIGCLATLAIQHARAHFKPIQPPEPEHHPTPQPNRLPAAIKEQMLEAAEAEFTATINRSTAELQHDLNATADRLSSLFDKLGNGIIKDESDKYQAVLAQLRTQAEVGVNGLSSGLAEHQAALQAEAAKQVAAQTAARLAKIDSKLSDAVAAFLTDALQQQVDLGAQAAYLEQTLEAHKADLKKELA